MRRRIGFALAGVVLLGAGIAIGNASAESDTDPGAAMMEQSPSAADPPIEAPTVVEEEDAPVSLPVAGVQVEAVVDGDTLDVVIAGESHRVRLLGVNAPESGECFAAEAHRHLADLVAGANAIEMSEQFPRRDRYGRLLTDVLVDGVSVSDRLVADGFALAVSYGESGPYHDALADAEREAKSTERGLWASDACGEPSAAGATIVHVEYDAPGDDNQAKNGEWVEITSFDDVDLTGWILKDESASHRFAFPSGLVLSAGQTIRVYSGCGSSTDAELFWCSANSAIWNNSGDTAFLLDPNGGVVSSWSY